MICVSAAKPIRTHPAADEMLKNTRKVVKWGVNVIDGCSDGGSFALLLSVKNQGVKKRKPPLV